MLLPRQFLFNLGPRSVLAFVEIHLSLHICILLLHLNHLLNLLRPHLLITFILLPLITVHLLLSLGLLRFLFRFQISHVLILVHLAVVLLLHIFVHVRFVRDLLHLLPLSLQLLVLHLHIASTLHYDVGGTFASFVDFFYCLFTLMKNETYSALFVLKEPNSIAKQL